MHCRQACTHPFPLPFCFPFFCALSRRTLQRFVADFVSCSISHHFLQLLHNLFHLLLLLMFIVAATLLFFLFFFISLLRARLLVEFCTLQQASSSCTSTLCLVRALLYICCTLQYKLPWSSTFFFNFLRASFCSWLYKLMLIVSPRCSVSYCVYFV